MTNINQQIKSLFTEQTANWAQAQKSYSDLDRVQIKSFNFGDFEIKVQFNPARIISSGAKMDAKSIAERKCFLCTENRPAGQNFVEAGDYLILVNPFPIFPEHFTIPRRDHVDQQILPYFTDMLQLAEAMDDFLVFYNGPKCGASAPDHMHFQAGTKDFLPLVNDYKRLKETHAEVLVESASFQLSKLNNYLRTVYCIESIDIDSARDSFEKLYSFFQTEDDVEPMMNIVCTFEAGKWFTFVLPRKAFRPWQYTAKGDRQLMVSPATVEMCGIFITPIKSHFERITREDVINILEQVSN
jgi:ATP adenylyltransferase/5',5'''-P-1,P-4-tetraphosphate phosphorylase II